MPRVILFGESDLITDFNETGAPDTVIRSIQSGLSQPKLPDPVGPFQEIYNGDMIIVARRSTDTSKKSKIHITPHEQIVLEGMVIGYFPSVSQRQRH